MKHFLLSVISINVLFIGCGRNNQQPSHPANSSVTQEQDRGGGNFTTALFWEKALSEIKPKLESLEDETIISKEDKENLIKLIDKNIVEVRLTEEPLYIVKDNESIPVDAVNYPAQKLIELYKPVWMDMVKDGYVVNYLILHEFLGLAKIDDTNYKVSAEIMPAVKMKISFSSNQVSCRVSGKFLFYDEKEWLIRDMPESEPVVKKFSEQQSVNNASYNKNDISIKAMRMDLPVVTDTQAQPDSEYYVVVDIQLVNSYKHRGIWDAFNEFFHEPAKLNITWRLLEKFPNGKIGSLAIAQSSTSTTDEMSDGATLSENIPVSSFAEKLSQNGFTLGLAPHKGEMSSMFHSYNIAGFLQQTASSQGLKGEAANLFVINKVLKGFPKAMPFRVWVSCSLLAPTSVE
ncbi:MAG: hypothetical protein V4596_12635 [Bdellovibrionota bacterium]